MLGFYPKKVFFLCFLSALRFSCPPFRFCCRFKWRGSETYFLLLSFFLINSLSLHSQSVGIFGSTSLGVNNTGAAGDASAIFDISSTAKGLLIPRMSTIQRNGITSPATSLMVFNTTTNQYEYYNGIAWVGLAVSGTGISSLNGLSSTSQSFANGATGAAPNWSSTGTTHTLNIPLASAAGVSAGLLSKTDYDIFNNKLSTSLADGNIWIGDGTSTAQQRIMSGDATISNTGVLTIGTGAITSTKIADGTITNADIASGTVSYSAIQNVSASRLLGNPSGAAAAPSEISLGTGLTFSAGNLIVSGGTLNGGTANYFPKWSSATALTSTSLIYDDGINVGIGTTIPSAALEIQKPSAPATELLRLRDNTAGKHIEFYSGTIRQRGGNLAFESYESGYTFSTGNPGTVKVAIQFGGNVGIGNTGPLAALDVVGQMYSRGNIVASSGSIDWNLGNNQTLQSATGSAITFTNMQDGGVYCLFITDGTSRTYTFSGTGLTFNFIQPNAATTAGQATLYKFNRIGSSVYVDWGPFGNSPLTGNGTTNYIPKWSSSTGLSSTSLLYDNGMNVGIGTTNPSHSLHIHETTINPYAHFTDDMTGSLSSDGLILGTNGAGTMYLINQETAYDFHIGNSTDNNLITVKGNANNVGIGTTAPSAKLDVITSGTTAISGITSGTGNAGYFQVNNAANSSTALYATTNGTGIALNVSNTNTAAGTKYSVYSTASSAAGTTGVAGYFTSTGGGTNYAGIFDNGNVGIGTANPLAKLEVFQNAEAVRIKAATATNTVFMRFTDGTNYNHLVGSANSTGINLFGSGLPYAFEIGTQNNHPITFHTNNISTPRMTIAAAGNIGIGTTSPVGKLHINAASDAIVIKDGALNEGIIFDKNMIRSGWTGTDLSISGSNNLYFQTFSGSWLSRVTILNNGNVGIGTTNPTAKLQVAGDVALGTGLTTGNEPVTVYLTNASGGSVSNGMIVITGGSNNSFTTTNAPNDTRAIGVVYDATIAAGAVGRVAIAGVVLVYHAGAILAADRGKHVVTSATPGQAAVVTNPTSGSSIGIVLEAPISAGLRGRMLLR